MKRIRILRCITSFLLLMSLFSFGGCGKYIPTLVDDPEDFYEAWDEAAFANIKPNKIKLADVFPEELNMETHSGLIAPEDFTGPILCFDGEPHPYFNGAFIPDQEISDYLANPTRPEEIEFTAFTNSAERIPDEFLSDEKLKALKRKKLPIVFAMVECTGYDHSTTFYYRSGTAETVYWLGWRVSFYSYPDCELLGWETAARPYTEPEAMSLDTTDLLPNGKRVYQKDEEGRSVDEVDVTMKLLYGESYGQAETEPKPQPAQSEDGLSTYTYDGQGNLKREDIHNENGELTEYIEYAYHIEGFLVTKTGYDKDGVLQWKAILHSDGTLSMYNTYYPNGQFDTCKSYDENGNLVEVVHFDEDGNVLEKTRTD